MENLNMDKSLMVVRCSRCNCKVTEPSEPDGRAQCDCGLIKMHNNDFTTTLDANRTTFLDVNKIRVMDSD